jgi:hypothetical protein
MKAKRGLSGIYFSFKDKSTKRVERRVFEDLPKSEQDRVISELDAKALGNMVKCLADAINRIGDDLDFVAEYDEYESLNEEEDNYYEG